jgi:hypothetical protein
MLAVASVAACRADGIFIELTWRSASCYAPAALEGFYGGLFMVGLTVLQLVYAALGLTQHTASRATCREALERGLRRLRCEGVAAVVAGRTGTEKRDGAV